MDYKQLRGKSPEEIFDAAAKESGVPTQILMNMWGAESAYGKNTGPSRNASGKVVGAIGHMQIMPRELGVMRSTYGEDLDPQELSDSVFMAAKMMKENLQHFGNIPDAVRAYNGGWKKERWGNAETTNYAKKVLGDMAGPQPVAGAFTTSRSDLDAAGYREPVSKKAPKPYLNDIEKNAIEQNMLASQIQGKSDEQVVNDATQLSTNPAAAYQLAQTTTSEPISIDYDNADAQLVQDEAASISDQARQDGVTSGQAASAAFEQYSLTTAIMDTLTNQKADLIDARAKVDLNWQREYEANRDEMIKGLSPYAVKQLDKAINPQEAADIVARDKRDQVNQQILTDSGHPIMWGLTAGLLDPAGWAVGAGVGKAFTIAKGMSTAMRMSKLAASNAVGNVAILGALDALGHQTTAEDYIHAGAFGLVTGGALGAVLGRSNSSVTRAAEDMHNAAVDRSESFIRAATRELGENASPEDIAARAKKMSQDEVMSTVNDVMTQTGPSSSKVFHSQQLSPTELQGVQERYGLDTVVDETALTSQASLHVSAEKFIAANSDVIDNARIAAQKNRAISDTMGWRSSGNELISDDDPLAKTLGMVVAEDAAGASGYRGVTASIKSRLLNNRFLNGVEDGINENYQVWLRDKGVGRAKGALNTYTTGKYLTEFYEQVATEIRSRANPLFVSSAPRSVQAAANVMQRGFQSMGDAQRSAKILGHEFIPSDSRGYLPQRLNGKVFKGLSKSERQQVQNAFTEQAVRDFGWDTEFAAKKVAEYLNRAEDRASGLGGGFQGASSDFQGGLLEELAKLDGSQYITALERLRKGAASHTRGRLDWDLTAQFTRDDGTKVPLSALYDNDVLSLYRAYASRASGDISMAHVGIYGDRDVRLITEALRRSTVGDSSKTIPAWQHVVNEIYNRPTASDAGGAFSTSARAIRQYTGIRLLGGVGFAQVAEISNAVGHLGVGRTLSLATKVPRVYKELKQIEKGIVPEDSILFSLDSVAGAPLGGEQFQMIMPQVVEEGLSIVDQRSAGNVMRVLGGAQLLHNKFSFMRAVSSVEQRLVGEEIVRKSFRYMREGKEDVALKEMGLNDKLVAKIKAEMDDIAEFDDRGYLKALNLTLMKDKAALEEFVVAVRRGTGQIIQETFPGETGKWMRSEVGQLLMQFRKFPSVAVEKQMHRQFGKFGFTRAMGSVTAAIGVGTLLYYGRAGLAASLMEPSARKQFLERRMMPAAVVGGALMYVSPLGMLSDFLAVGSGVGNLVDDQLDLGWSNGRGIQSQGIGGLIPSLGTLSDAYNLTQNPTAEGALKLLPFTNLPMVLPAINALKHADDD